MEQKNKTHQPVRKSGIFFGLALLLIGVVLIAINFGWFTSGLKHVLISWQMFLILIGIGQIFSSISKPYRGKLFWGLCLIITGGFFIIPRLARAFPDAFSNVTADFTSMYWPVLLIAAGLLIIIFWISKPKRSHKNEYKHCHSHGRWQNIDEITSEDPSTGFFKTHKFSGGEYIILDPVFYGGEVEAFFGGVVLDLRKTTLPEGDTLLKIDSIFGGISIFVPDNWQVEPHIDAVFGGLTDNRYRKDVIDPSRKLIIEGDCVFGGCELKN